MGYRSTYSLSAYFKGRGAIHALISLILILETQNASVLLQVVSRK